MEWDRGCLRRIPLGVRKIGQIGSTGKSFLLENAAKTPELTARPDWIDRGGIQGFAGHPLIFPATRSWAFSELSRAFHFHEVHFTWLRLFAD